MGRSDSDAETVAKEFLAKMDRMAALMKRKRKEEEDGEEGGYVLWAGPIEKLFCL